jgi:hypothetical protein
VILPNTYEFCIWSRDHLLKHACTTVTTKYESIVWPGWGGLAQLCQWIDCGFGPKIEETYFSFITSEGWAMIKGSGLGNDEGELWLRGLKKPDGTPLGDQPLDIPTEPGKDFWKPTRVFGTIPVIVGVRDQPATLVIKTKAGKWSNEFPVNFIARKDTKQLGWEVDFVCSHEADLDSCNGQTHSDNPPFCSPPFTSAGSVGGTFAGYHWTCIGSSDGTDTFWRPPLLNGWVFYDAVLVDYSGSVFQTVTMSGFQSDTTFTVVTLKWDNQWVPYVTYRVYVSIVGPKGVPYK